MTSQARKPYWHLLAACVVIALTTHMLTNQRYLPLEVTAPKLVIQTGDKAGLIAFCPDGRRVVTADGRRAQVKDLSDGAVLANMEGHAEDISALAVSGNLALTGSSEGTARLWDLRSGLQLKVLPAKGKVEAVALDGERLAAGCEDGSVMLWSTDGQQLGRFCDHLGEVSALSFVANQLVSASADGTVKIRELPSGRLRANLKAHRESICSLATDGSLVAAGTPSGCILIWNTRTGQLQDRIRVAGAVTCLGFTPGHSLYYATQGPKECQVQVRKMGEARSFLTIQKTRQWAALSPAGGTLAVSSSEGDLDLWDLRSSKKLTRLRRQPELRCLEFTPGGTLVAATPERTYLWDRAALKHHRDKEESGPHPGRSKVSGI